MSTALTEIAYKMGTTFHDPKFLLLGYDTCKKLGVYKEILVEINKMRQMVLKIVQNKEKAYIARGRVPVNDLIENLFHFRDNNPDYVLTDQDIVDDYMTFFLGGSDTTSKLNQIFLY